MCGTRIESLVWDELIWFIHIKMMIMHFFPSLRHRIDASFRLRVFFSYFFFIVIQRSAIVMAIHGVNVWREVYVMLSFFDKYLLVFIVIGCVYGGKANEKSTSKSHFLTIFCDSYTRFTLCMASRSMVIWEMMMRVAGSSISITKKMEKRRKFV